MKISLLLSAMFAVSLSLPSLAQTQIPAPRGWTTQAKTNGATTFTPPDLRAGEVYSVTIYDAVLLDGQTLEEYLRKFAGPVGSKPGQLTAPLEIKAADAQTSSGYGVYTASRGKPLSVAFIAFSPDGEQVCVARTLFSRDELFLRYREANGELVSAMARRTASVKADRDLPNASPDGAPSRESRRLAELGGAIVPGIYAGDQYDGETLKYRLRVYLYPNGEYRIRDANDGAYRAKYGGASGVGSYSYDPENARLEIESDFSLFNDSFSLCLYGRNRAGQPAIYAEHSGFSDSTPVIHTALTLVAPLTRDDLPSVIQAREDARQKAKLAAATALERGRKAKYDAIKTTVAPGRGVSDAQIAAILHNRDATSQQIVISGGGNTVNPYVPGAPVTFTYNAPIYGSSSQITDEAYLLLRDGTVYRGLQSAPDQLDVAAARRKDPDRWGKWKRVGGKIQLSFAGKPFEALPTDNPGQEFGPVQPNAPGTRFGGHYTAFDPELSLDITFLASGRFTRKLNPKNDTSAPFILSKAAQPARGGDAAGTYDVGAYSLTLRYDDGKVERMPFFFLSKNRETLWFEGHQVGQYDNLRDLLKKRGMAK